MAEDGTRTAARNFPTTRASAILGLHSADPQVRARSLGRLAQLYWRPIYKYLRLRWRKAPDEAQETTQEFFLRSIDAGTFGAYEPERAHFRTFLRVCLDRFVLDRSRRRLTKKRGQGTALVPLDIELLEKEIRDDAHPQWDPEQLFEKEWVRSLVVVAVDALREACHENGKEEHFRVFERCYLGPRDQTYAAIAAELHLSVSNVMNRLAYARREFRAIVLEMLRELTSSDQELRAEAQLVLGIELGAAGAHPRGGAH